MIIAPSAELSDYLDTMLSSLGNIRVLRVLAVYPNPYEVVQMLNTAEPGLLLLDLGRMEAALQVARLARAARPHVGIVGFSTEKDGAMLPLAKAAGINEILCAPFSREDLQHALAGAAVAQRSAVLGALIALLPAKAGSGASTAALHLAGALTRETQGKVCLMDADLHSGLLALTLNLNPRKSIIEALESAQHLDARLWNTFVTPVQGMDVLVTPRAKRVQMFSQLDYLHLLAFARENYDFLVADLPEIVNDATEAIVREAKAVYVVCTPELPSLFLARRRIFELQTRGVRQDALGIVLNRCVSRSVQVAEAETVLEQPVSAVLPNDYAGIQEALREARLVEGHSELAEAFAVFARSLVEPANDASSPETRGLLARWLSSD